MTFNIYLKDCRERYGLTQLDLVQELFNRSENFSGLDIGALSRWERGVSLPSLDKKVEIVHFFHSLGRSIFPCFEEHTCKEIENDICTLTLKDLMGNSKMHISSFPIISFPSEPIELHHLRKSNNMDMALEIPYAILQSFAEEHGVLKKETLKTWALHESNLFLIAEAHGQFFGLFFCLRLKVEIFEKLMNFEMTVLDIKNEDFAPLDEEGCSYTLVFFANNEEVATLFFRRYYAELIKNQQHTKEIGTTIQREGAKKMVTKMKMLLHKEHANNINTRASFRAPLAKVLINESVIKMLFQKQDVLVGQ